MTMATKHKNYYTSESVGIATGRVDYALHNAGLATLTHTPSPMKFLSQILERPSHERPFSVAGHWLSCRGHLVPDIKRLPLDKIATFPLGGLFVCQQRFKSCISPPDFAIISATYASLWLLKPMSTQLSTHLNRQRRSPYGGCLRQSGYCSELPLPSLR